MFRLLFKPFLFLAAALVICGGPVYAHHSFAMFDLKKDVTIKGKVSEFQWTNPHVFVEVRVLGSDGIETNWSIEAGAPNILARQGWKRTSLKPGEEIEVELHPLRSGATGGALVSVRKADGTVLKG